MDVDSIEPGLDFVSILESQVSNCEILLVLIGRGWLSASDDAEKQRLTNPVDFVRIAIASGLTQGKRVIPVLIGQASMPRVEDLPEEIKPLTRRQAIRLTHENFNADVERLIRVLRHAFTDAENRTREHDRKRAGEEAGRTADRDTGLFEPPSPPPPPKAAPATSVETQLGGAEAEQTIDGPKQASIQLDQTTVPVAPSEPLEPYELNATGESTESPSISSHKGNRLSNCPALFALTPFVFLIILWVLAHTH